MRYKIIDTQVGYYFTDDIFNSLKEVCKRLISYHEIDTNMSEAKQLLKEKK